MTREPSETVPALALHDAERRLTELYDAAMAARDFMELADEMQRGLFSNGEPGTAADALERLDTALAHAGEWVA
jgi:dihydroxyacetone kinase